MSTLAADTTRFFESNHDDMLNEVPIIASDTVYAGAAVGESSSTGTGRPLVALDNFLGFCTEKVANETGSASAKNIKVRSRGTVRLAVTGVSSTANVGDDVYASDDDTFTTTATGNSWIGKIQRWEVSTTCLVYFQATILAPAASDAVLNSIQSGDAALTVTGKTGAAASAGGTVDLVGGTGGSTSGTGGAATSTGGTGTGTGTGGAVTLTGGTSGAGATGNGGAANLVGGAAASVAGTGGAVVITGGLGTTTGAGGAVTITSGAAGSTGVAGAIAIAVGAATAGNGSAITLTGGNGASSTNSGGNVNLIPGTAVSTGTPGEFQINSTAGTTEFSWLQSTVAAVPVSGSSYVIALANRAYRVKAMRICCSSSATVPTVDLRKDTGTTAPGSGTTLLTGVATFSGTANTVVSGTLISTVASLTMAAGDRLSVTFGGTVGSIINATVSVLVVPC